jgi:hypothetical protein
MMTRLVLLVHAQTEVNGGERGQARGKKKAGMAIIKVGALVMKMIRVLTLVLLSMEEGQPYMT